MFKFKTKGAFLCLLLYIIWTECTQTAYMLNLTQLLNISLMFSDIKDVTNNDITTDEWRDYILYLQIHCLYKGYIKLHAPNTSDPHQFVVS